MSELSALIADRIRTNGPISLAEFISLSLYHPTYGYYARASCRTGRAGDFFTSVDVGPVFGELLTRQLAEMWTVLRSRQSPTPDRQAPFFDLVEAGAGSGRLARDVLDAAARHHPEFYQHTRLHLIEVAPTARAAQVETLGPHASKLVRSSDSLSSAPIDGVILANELLDALPTHAVVMRKDGLREVFVDFKSTGGSNVQFVECERAPSTPELERYLAAVGARLEAGWRTEINLEAPVWIREAARTLRRGFLMLMDYGHDAWELYSASHSAGTLTTFQRHTSEDPLLPLQDPGEHDITAHVDLTTVTRAAESAGLVTLGRLDQTYFLLGLGLAEMLDARPFDAAQGRPFDATAWKRRLALKTLMLPGGLGSTLKVLIFGKDVGTPKLKGLSYKVRLT